MVEIEKRPGLSLLGDTMIPLPAWLVYKFLQHATCVYSSKAALMSKMCSVPSSRKGSRPKSGISTKHMERLGQEPSSVNPETQDTMPGVFLLHVGTKFMVPLTRVTSMVSDRSTHRDENPCCLVWAPEVAGL